MEALQKKLKEAIKESGGLFRMEPTLVAREFGSAGTRLGLPEQWLDAGERGMVCERWFASEVSTQFNGKNKGEGLSLLKLKDASLFLKDAVQACPEGIMGSSYAENHKTLGRLAKLYDYGGRIFCHYHQRAEDAALIDMLPKDEAYYFPEGQDTGTAPVAYFGCHPGIVEDGKQKEVFLPYLKNWKGADITRHMRGYLTVPGDGFCLPSGILHAPSSALTLELQEPSDVWAVIEPEVDGSPIDKELMYRSVPKEYRESYGEEGILDQVDWKACGEPYFYEKHHTPPLLIKEDSKSAEYWIFYNSDKFSGKRQIIRPGSSTKSREAGVYNLYVRKGKGSIGGMKVEGNNPGLDELLICCDRAQDGVEIKNTGNEDLEIFKFFGPDIHEVPKLG